MSDLVLTTAQRLFAVYRKARGIPETWDDLNGNKRAGWLAVAELFPQDSPKPEATPDDPDAFLKAGQTAAQLDGLRGRVQYLEEELEQAQRTAREATERAEKKAADELRQQLAAFMRTVSTTTTDAPNTAKPAPGE